MKNVPYLFLFLALPSLAMAQFNIGQTSGANITYYDFPDTTVCFWGLESIFLDLDGDQVDDLKVVWYLAGATPHQGCLFPRCIPLRPGNDFLEMQPASLAQGNNLLTQIYHAYPVFVDYCVSEFDSTDIVRTEIDVFGPSGDYILIKLDSSGFDYAWLRASTDTTGGNYCVTFKDAARYRNTVAVDPLAEAGAGLQVFPTVVSDALWLKGAFPKPVRLDVKFIGIDGRQLGQTEVEFPGGQARLEVPYPSAASGVVLIEISGENVRKVEKLIFAK